jgi:hypothetical protein
VLFRLNRVDEADKAVQAAGTKANLSSDSAYFVAEIWSARGHKDEARKLLKLALGTSGAFAFRKDAEKLLAAIEK